MNVKIAFVGSRTFTEETYNRVITLLDCLDAMRAENRLLSFYLVLPGLTQIEDDLKNRAEKIGISCTYTKTRDLNMSGTYGKDVRKVHPNSKRISKKAFFHLCLVTRTISQSDLAVCIPNNGKGRGGFALLMANYLNKPYIDMTSKNADDRMNKLVERLSKLQSSRKKTSTKTAYIFEDTLAELISNSAHTPIYYRNIADYMAPNTREETETLDVNMPPYTITTTQMAPYTEMPTTLDEYFESTRRGPSGIHYYHMIEIVYSRSTTAIDTIMGVYDKRNITTSHFNVAYKETIKNRAVEHLQALLNHGRIDIALFERAVDLLRSNRYFITLV